ncbi:MAG: FGGY-family carbohydrate kinase [Bacillales bacterium]|nr:FGGY-family carbohydrate kinase [Bacillales bacterium]MDY6003061.1 FGGY-family carbohydrate kinase [Bacilli bacterium]
MKDNLILTIDFGTQSVRVAIFNKKGDILAIEKKPYEPAYFSKKPGYAEQDPNYYLSILADCSKAIKTKHPELMENVQALTLTCFRDSPVVLDKDNNLLRPCILWLDERRAKASEKIPFLYRLIFSIIGMSDTIVLNRQRTMAHWIKENEPDIWSKTDKYMNISTWLTMKLVGEYIDSSANQAGHYPINFKKGEWYKSDKHLKGSMFGVPKKLLCKLVQPGETLGYVTKEASELTGLPEGLKMIAAGSDKSCETLGLGAMKDEYTAAVSYGTASTLDISISKYKESERFLPSYPAVHKGYYNMEIQVYRGYWMLNWFAKEFGEKESLEAAIQHRLTLELLNEEMLKIPPGSEGLVLQPYWGPGLSRPLSKGAIIGFSDTHTRIHLYRAIIEGIAYALRDGLEEFESRRLHHKIKEIRISGGGSQSDAICQITSDIFGLPVSRVQTYETSSLGAAIVGFIGINEYQNIDDATKEMVKVSKTFYPNMDNHQKYDYLFYKAYRKMYPKLKGIYKDVKNFNNKF